MNCKITVERHGSLTSCFKANRALRTEYEFDDYRVAAAIENLLANINDVEVTCRYYDPKKENTNND